MNEPHVSVIIPTHNRRDWLERAMCSALAQTESRLEVIVVDDASSDGTADFLGAQAAADSRVRVLRNSTALGGGGARNAGIAIARAPWVAFLDDDDEWMPEKLARQLRLLVAHPGAVACSASFEQHFPGGRVRHFAVAAAPSLDDLLYDNVLGGASVCVCRRDTLVAIGGFDPRLRSAQDYDLWIRLRERGQIVACNEPLVKYREHDGLRITNQAASRYRGSRRLYIKHRRAMNDPTRRRHLAFLCSLKAREPNRPSGARWRYLAVALKHSTGRVAMSYAARGTLSILGVQT
jgi:glycosyltransferase involved in cell wall biosynthesis